MQTGIAGHLEVHAPTVPESEKCNTVTQRPAGHCFTCLSGSLHRVNNRRASDATVIRGFAQLWEETGQLADTLQEKNWEQLSDTGWLLPPVSTDILF
jgi:hypothetical protein